jgi:hypothetical protein
VRENMVADTSGEYDLVVPQRGIWGTAGVGGWNIDKCVRCLPVHVQGRLCHRKKQLSHLCGPYFWPDNAGESTTRARMST